MTNIRAFLLTAVAVSQICFSTPVLSAQEQGKLLLRVDPDTTPRAMNVVYVRPNAATTTTLYLQNLGEDVPNTATIKLVQIAGKQTRVIGQATRNAKDKDGLLDFAKVKDAKDAKDAADKIDLSDPPYQLRLLVEAAGQEFFKGDFDLRIRPARDLVTASAKYDRATRELRITVALKEAFDAKGCPVELVLGPAFKETKDGTFKQVLTTVKQNVELIARGVEFLPGVNVAGGRVYLNVNGYDRAFTYQATLKDTGALQEITFDNQVGARLRAPRYALPSDKFKIGLEMDGGLDVGQLEVGLDRTGKRDLERFQVRKLPGLRRQKVHLSIGPAGELVWQSDVRDWQPEFDTTDVFGPVTFQVRVLSGGKGIDLVPTPGKRAGETYLQADPDLPGRLFAQVILDNSPPENVKFVNLKTEWAKGKAFPVQARADSRDKGRLAPIVKAVFFQGKTPANGKVKEDAVLALGELDAASGLWKAEIPATDKESLELNVQLATATGMEATPARPTMIFFHAAGSAKWATVKGSVVYGDLRQPEVTVTLGDANGKVKGTAKTDDKGAFAFEKVVPGSYYVTASKNFPALIGQVPFEVPGGQDLVENVAVRLRAK